MKLEKFLEEYKNNMLESLIENNLDEDSYDTLVALISCEFCPFKCNGRMRWVDCLEKMRNEVE